MATKDSKKVSPKDYGKWDNTGVKFTDNKKPVKKVVKRGK